MTPRVIVVMGVSGCGKSTVGERLADRLGLPFVEGDALHPPANVEKMRQGTPLTDADRWPWLARVGEHIAELAGGSGGVIACSALKRAYRDVLRSQAGDIFFIHLAAPREVIAGRVAGRRHAYMPAALLDSQYADLEPLEPDEAGVTLDVSQPPDAVLAAALGALA